MKYRIIFISSITIIALLYIWHPNSLFITDIWFHLLLAKQSATQSLIPIFDTYTFQPIGRVQIYPPLLHVFTGLLSHVVSWNIIVHYLGLIFYLLFLTVLYVFSAHFWKEKMALIITLLATLSLTNTLTFFSLMPSSVCMILLLLTYLNFYKKRYLISGFLLTVAFYLHPVFPFLGALGLFYYSKRYSTGQISAVKKVISGALLIALPWFVWVLSHWTAFNFERFWLDNPLEGFSGFSFISHIDINIIYLPLALWGMYSTRKINDNGLNLVRSLMYGFLPVLFFYGGRYTWHFMPLFNIFTVYAISKLSITKKINKLPPNFPNIFKLIYVSLLLILILLLPTPLFNYPPSYNPNGYFSFDWSVFALPIISNPGFSETKDFKNVVDIVNDTSTDTIIVANKPDVGNAISFYSDRKSDYGSYWENTSNEMLETIKKYRETERPRIFIYKNEEIPYPVDNVYNIGEYTIGERF